VAESLETRGFIDSLGPVKDAIGEWHDWEELIAIASDLDEHRPNCKLVRELKTISDRKYERALSLTNEIEEELSPRVRRSQKTNLHGPSREGVCLRL